MLLVHNYNLSLTALIITLSEIWIISDITNVLLQLNLLC
jgi:hypothetical protein